jgi:uncharacterized membrane protein YbaN (DUF454 family)
MLRHTQIVLWRILAIASLIAGLIGLALPIVPTVPFLILAAWAGSKAWPSLEQWLLSQRTFGPHIRNWRERGTVPRRAKVLASGMMLVSASGLQLSPTPLWLKILVPLTMLAVAIWLWRRPETR